MSLNWVMLDARRQPVPLPQERILSTVNNVDTTINIMNPPRTVRATGTLWLTTERCVFVASQQSQSTSLFALVSQALPASIKPDDTNPNLPLESLSLPWPSVLSTSFVQPYFAANYLSMDVNPSPGGGLTLGTRVEVRLTDQGMFEFIKKVENVRARAIEKAREARMGDPLPMYDQPPPTTTSTALPPQPADDLPPGYSV